MDYFVFSHLVFNLVVPASISRYTTRRSGATVLGNSHIRIGGDIGTTNNYSKEKPQISYRERFSHKINEELYFSQKIQ